MSVSIFQLSRPPCIRKFGFLFFWGLAASVLPARDLVPLSPFEQLWQEAESRELWNDPQWWNLGHYHRTMWLRVESRIDDKDFFLHPDGKTNRKAELKETLKVFLSAEPEDGESRTAACRFPARRKWLLQTFDLPEEAFPAGDCEEFHQSVSELQIRSATLIYPSAYLNSPASMFGHLLLVLDREGKDRLLSRAVNYAAVVQDSFGPLFAFKGIFGLYDGLFAILPYYDKVEEYSAVNRRDIWEYPLELTEDELDSLLRHVWELQGLRSRYFFFKENCAYNLIYPIQVARPSIEMLRRFRMSAAPVSLLQQLTRTGVTGRPGYRPSKATVMKTQADALSREELARAEELVNGASLDGSESALLLSFAFEWVQFAYTEGDLDAETYRQRMLPLLRARSKLGKVEMPEAERPVSPDQGHAPRRLTLYGGADTLRGELYTGARLRASYHDWLDDPAGYPPGSSIRMFEVDVQGRPDTGEVYLNDFTLVNIRSQTPPEPWVSPLSWAVHFGAEADPFAPNHHRVPLRFASGFTRQAGDRTTVYLMFTQLVMWDTNLKSNFSWEPGVEWGAQSPGSRFSAGLRGRHTWGVLGTQDSRHQVEAEMRTYLSRSSSLGLAMTYLKEAEAERNLATLNFYQTF